jgi:hypothetical protein
VARAWSHGELGNTVRLGLTPGRVSGETSLGTVLLGMAAMLDWARSWLVGHAQGLSKAGWLGCSGKKENGWMGLFRKK